MFVNDFYINKVQLNHYFKFYERELYIKEDTEKCKPSNIGAGYTPNNTVNATNVNNIMNSRLVKSGILNLKNLENDPAKAILLNIQIVYAALKTIEELANAPNKGDLSKVP